MQQGISFASLVCCSSFCAGSAEVEEEEEGREQGARGVVQQKLPFQGAAAAAVASESTRKVWSYAVRSTSHSNIHVVASLYHSTKERNKCRSFHSLLLSFISVDAFILYCTIRIFIVSRPPLPSPEPSPEPMVYAAYCCRLQYVSQGFLSVLFATYQELQSSCYQRKYSVKRTAVGKDGGLKGGLSA